MTDTIVVTESTKLKEVVKSVCEIMLRLKHGNQFQSAVALGISPAAFNRKVKLYGLGRPAPTLEGAGAKSPLPAGQEEQ